MKGVVWRISAYWRFKCGISFTSSLLATLHQHYSAIIVLQKMNSRALLRCLLSWTYRSTRLCNYESVWGMYVCSSGRCSCKTMFVHVVDDASAAYCSDMLFSLLMLRSSPFPQSSTMQYPVLARFDSVSSSNIYVIVVAVQEYEVNIGGPFLVRGIFTVQRLDSNFSFRETTSNQPLLLCAFRYMPRNNLPSLPEELFRSAQGITRLWVSEASMITRATVGFFSFVTTTAQSDSVPGPLLDLNSVWCRGVRNKIMAVHIT